MFLVVMRLCLELVKLFCHTIELVLGPAPLPHGNGDIGIHIIIFLQLEGHVILKLVKLGHHLICPLSQVLRSSDRLLLRSDLIPHTLSLPEQIVVSFLKLVELAIGHNLQVMDPHVV